jgi:uroporphyrinogen-III synthase
VIPLPSRTQCPSDRSFRRRSGDRHRTVDRLSMPGLASAALIAPKCHSTNLWIVKGARRRNHQARTALESRGRQVHSCSSYQREPATSRARCKAPMQEVVRIARSKATRVLIAYERPSGGYVTSDLTPNPQPPGK